MHLISHRQAWPRFRLKKARHHRYGPPFENEEALIISEPLSYRYNLNSGDVLELDTNRGKKTFEIAGVYFDYGSDLGTALLDRTTFEVYFGQAGVSTMALYLKEGVAPADAISHLRTLVDDDQEVMIRANQTLRALSIEVFDRTFAITNILRLLAIGVAFIGHFERFDGLTTGARPRIGGSASHRSHPRAGMALYHVTIRPDGA